MADTFQINDYNLKKKEPKATSLSSLLMALGLSAGLHPWGHVQSGNDLNVPVTVDYGKGVEYWNTPDKKKDAEIAAGGFGIQNRLAQSLMGTPQEPSMRLANALYKAGYLSGFKTPGIEGDVNDIQRLSGNKYTKHLLGASALFDLYKSQKPNSNFNLDFIAPEGAPGLMGTWRW